MLLIAALSLVAYNTYTDKRAGEISTEVLEKVKAAIPETEPESEADSSAEPNLVGDETEDSSPEAEEEQGIEIDGRWYIGILDVPAIDLELPVQSGWNYYNLDIGPCRYYGSVETGDMVIAAHNYASFFKRIQELNSGDEIIFTELSGRKHYYEVEQTQLVDGYDVDSMISGSDDWDLTLFTCTWTGKSRVTVRAVEVYSE
jgi:sortase A